MVTGDDCSEVRPISPSFAPTHGLPSPEPGFEASRLGNASRKAFGSVSAPFSVPSDALTNGRFAGKCVLTLGTGKTTDEALSNAGLIPSHNYAVVGTRLSLCIARQ